MNGTILDVINAGSFYLLIVDARDRIVEQGIERRQMLDIVEGEGLSMPGELVGREVEMAADGLVVEFA